MDQPNAQSTMQHLMNLESVDSDYRLARMLERIYGNAAPAVHERVKALIAAARAARPADLAAIDRARAADAGWTGRSGETVYACYVDRFAANLAGAIARLEYLQALGVRWLHLLPLLKARPEESDGGFAVADYRAVDPALGTMDQLEQLMEAARERGIGVILDIVCNHTAREHRWAEAARQGEAAYRDYYHVVDSADAVAEWERGLIDVFPVTAPGNFTHDAAMRGWVWTTFYPFQWDLNFANPSVFCEMLDILLFLANKGVQGFRLDSAPFLWKRLGTTCRGEPEAFAIVGAFRAALDLAAPSTILLAEAIESPEDVIPFFGNPTGGCDLAYNNGVMTALWAGLADADARIVDTMLCAAAQRPPQAAWLNYVRCHDDLIWNALSGYAPAEDLARWSAFYDGGGFSDGQRFQTAPGGVPSTNGMAAALVGIGRADVDQDAALARLTLLYGVIHALDGWPMVYMGDEIALGNDRAYRSDPARAADGRWLQRPAMDWARAAAAESGAGPAGTMLAAVRHFGAVARGLNRRAVAGRALPIAIGNRSVLAFGRKDGRRFACFANLSPTAQTVDRPAEWDVAGTDLLTDCRVPPGPVPIAPYGLLWWVAD